MKSKFLGAWIGLCLSLESVGQLTLLGTVDSQWRHYQAWGQELRMPPNAYFVTGKLMGQWKDKIRIPVNFSFTNQRVLIGVPSFQIPKRWAQSFNRISLQPRWKSHQGYLGTHALTFSPYTLAGHRVQGLGYVFRSPSLPWYGGIQGGQFLQRVLPDSLGISRPSYARWGGSAKVGYQHAKGFVEVSHLLTSDVWSGQTWDRILPEKNQATSLAFRQQVAEAWRLSGTYGQSSLWRDETLGWSRLPTRRAWKMEGAYQQGDWEGGLAYAHIDPQFRTHGAYLINSDLDTYSGFGSWRKEWGEIRGEMGLEQSTRQTLRVAREARWVHRWNAQARWKSGAMAEMGWSNFTSVANLRPELLYLQAVESWPFVDTLNFRQVNQQWTGQWMVPIRPSSSADHTTTLSVNSQWQQAKDSQGAERRENKIFSGQMTLQRASTKQKSNWQVGVQALQSTLGTVPEWMVGPQFQWKYPIVKDRLDWVGQLAQSQFWSDGQTTRQLWTAWVGSTARLGKHHQISLQARWLHQQGPFWGRLTEQTLTLSYQYQWQLTLIPPKTP